MLLSQRRYRSLEVSVAHRFHSWRKLIENFEQCGFWNSQIEILNEDFFEGLKSCQILHLRPKFYNLDSNEYLSIEDKLFNEVKAD